MATTSKAASRSLDQPDEHVEKGGVQIDVVYLGDIKVKRAKYPPRWKFSKDMGPDRCQDNPAVVGAVDAEPAVAGDAVLGALFGHDPGDVRVGRVERDREAEAARKTVPLEPLPRVAVVVGAVDAAVVLLPQTAGTGRVGEQLVDALAHVRERVVREEVRGHALVDRSPALAAVLAPEAARRRDRGVDPVVGELDRVAAHAAGARLPALSGRMLEETPDELEGDAAVVGAEEDAGIAAKPERVRPRLDVPGRVQLQLAILGQAEGLGTLPRLPAVGGAMDGGAVDEVVRSGVERPVAWVDDGVVDRPAGEERPLGLSLVHDEEPLPRSGE